MFSTLVCFVWRVLFNMSGFMLWWICLLHFGTARRICDFKLGIIQAVLRCEETPTADDIILAKEQLEKRNISGITDLYITECNITKISSGIFDFHTVVKLVYLSLSYNRLTSLPENLFNSTALCDVEQLDLGDNELSFLSPKHFAYLQNLHILYLGNNKFTTFQPGLFASNSISSLYLDKNYIEKLPEDFLSGTVSLTLTRLSLSDNKLRQIPYFYLPKLSVLNLRENFIGELPAGLFNSTDWSVLENIFLSSNQIKTLPMYFSYSPALSKINSFEFGHNNIEVLPDEIFYSPYLQNLVFINFSHNNITHLSEKLFHSPFLGNLSYVDFSHNKIADLPMELFHSPYLEDLLEIDLSFNQISSIPSMFLNNKALEKLERISLNNNNIKSVTEDMLPTKLLGLCYLNLANNKISSIGKMIQKVMWNMDLRHEESFECGLDISHNLLTVQQTNFIHMKGRIDGYLDLSKNKISKFELIQDSVKGMSVFHVAVPLGTAWLNTFGNKPFSILNLLQVAFNIDLNHTDLFLRNPIYHTVGGLFRLHILIQAFPYDYDCNCDMLKYVTLLKSDIFTDPEKYHGIQFRGSKRYRILLSVKILKNLKCGAPKRLYGKYLYQLNETDLQCKHSRCTAEKRCTCIETPYNNTVRINCSQLNINFMPFIEHYSSKIQIYMSFNDIYQFPFVNFTESIQVTLLDLSYNFLANIPTTFFSYYRNMKHLNLAGNRLTAIHSANEWNNLNSLQDLELRENNFTCNCSALKLKETLISLNQKAAVDLKNIKCSFPLAVKGKVIYSLTDVSFGCPVVNLILILTLTLSLLLFFSVAMFIAYVFRYYISLFLFIHFGWRFWYSYTKEETLYDAFISYSTKDSDWVIDLLVNPLENMDPPYHLCLHERDFLIGEPICDNIRKAVEGSKCTICVVSKNWLESEWCQFEFRVAHGVASVEKQIRLLVILKEEIPKNKITGYLKFYMKTFTYLDSAHPLFWSRLLNDLPRPDGENIREENEQRHFIELV